MDEGVGVNTFDGTGNGKHGVYFAPYRFCCCEAEDRPDSFPASKKTVPHGFKDGARFMGRRRHNLIQGLFNKRLAFY
jgi:hypothetical protein